jgi:rfaE bifunctional protein nucleotidyltransferase chain/domain/rfaE bifunctional protein kinase chain/domain
MTEISESTGLSDLVARWQGRRVLVLGDALLDDWRHGEPDRLCREAPVPVVAVDRIEYAPGGAANTAMNIAALGGEAVLVAPVADDAEGAWLRRRLAEANVELHPVVVAGWRTPTKRRVVAAGQLVVRMDDGHSGTLPEGARRMQLAMIEAVLEVPPAAVVICDYGYGAADDQVRQWLGRRRPELPVLAVDAHEPRRWTELRPTLVTPSFAEAWALLGQPAGEDRGGEERASLAVARSADLLDSTGAALVAVTLDGDGAVVLGRGAEPLRTHACPAPASHAVGAGDAYLAAFTLAAASGAGTSDAARLAQLAATTAICGPRTCVATRAGLLAALPGPEPGPAHRVLDVDDLVARIGAERARGGRIVFTNGCFDVLHAGHVGFLEQARTLGDVLVVAVNSDRSVRRLKGLDRPVNGEDDRTVVLTALSCVDYVVVFDAETPAQLIEQVRPDIYVKGGDYHADLLPEAGLVERLGGRVEILDYVPDRSTSAVIERIRSRAVREVP